MADSIYWSVMHSLFSVVFKGHVLYFGIKFITVIQSVGTATRPRAGRQFLAVGYELLLSPSIHSVSTAHPISAPLPTGSYYASSKAAGA